MRTYNIRVNVVEVGRTAFYINGDAQLCIRIAKNELREMGVTLPEALAHELGHCVYTIAGEVREERLIPTEKRAWSLAFKILHFGLSRYRCLNTYRKYWKKKGMVINA